MSRPQEGKEEAISQDGDVERRGARQPSSPIMSAKPLPMPGARQNRLTVRVGAATRPLETL